ncbi:hypothetical protein Dimus_024696, partial [Dionaea muscipula]
MVGRRRGSLNRRVREVGCDPSSPDPHCRGLTRGSPSPTAPHFRRPPPSPGLRQRHRRSPSPMPLSSPDPEGFSSSEDGDATVAAVTLSEKEDHSDLEVALTDSPRFPRSSSFPELGGMKEGLTAAASSGSSTISPTTAVLLCQNAIVSGGLEDGRLILARSDSVCSISSPSLGGTPEVSDSVRMEVVGGDGGQEGAELAIAPVSLPCSSLPQLCASLVGVDAGGCSVAVGDYRNTTVTGVEAQCTDRTTVHLPHFSLAHDIAVDVGRRKMSAVVQSNDRDKGSLSHAVQTWVDGNNLRQVHSLRQVDGSNLHVVDGPPFASSSPLLDGSVGCAGIGGGSVSEEVRVASVAKEALRSQPTDGLRQPPSSSTVPESGAKGGVGMDGNSGCRSYAHVVQ